MKANRRPLIVPHKYTTIQAAVNAAMPGDEIIVKDILQPEEVVIDNTNTT